MAGFLPPNLQNLLPPTMTQLQVALARSMVENTCDARFGVGPPAGTNVVASENCHICTDALAGNLNLSHRARGDQAGEDRSTRPCERTYHLLCLVDWAESNINLNRPITCPGDRLPLIPQEESDALIQRFNIRPPLQHPIRDIDQIFQWWTVLYDHGLGGHPPDTEWDIQELDITSIIRAASNGMDVGIVHTNVVGQLPLAPNVRYMYHRYARQRQVVDGPLDQNGNAPVGDVYPIFVYINTVRELGNHETGEERAEYVLVPITRRTWRSLRRYLFGMMGPIVAVSWPENEDLRIIMLNMRTVELVDLHAEAEIRNLMRAERDGVRPPATHIWYWPYPTNGGGIVVGGQLVDTRYPARGLPFDNLNVTQYSEAAYARVLDRLDQNQLRFTQDRIADYMNGRLPETFPEPLDTIASEVFHIPHYRPPQPPGAMFNGPAPQQAPDAITQLPGAERQSTYQNYYNHFLRQEELRRRNQQGPWVPWNPPYRSPARPLPTNADGTYDMTDFDYLVDHL